MPASPIVPPSPPAPASVENRSPAPQPGSPRGQGQESLFRQFWAIFIANAAAGVALAGAMLNMVEFSRVIWPADPFHALEIGLLFSVKTWATALAGLGVGFVADRSRKISRKAMLVLMLVLMGLGRFLNGFVTATDPRGAYAGFLGAWLLFGFAFGGIAPLVLSFSNDAVPQARRSQFFGRYEAFSQISRILGMLASAWLVQSGWWRQYFWIMGSVLFGAAGLVAVSVREPKRGGAQHQLVHVLARDDTFYDYKLTRETVKATIFSPTNVIAFVEGIFTWMVFSVALYLLYPYLQNPPNNVSPVMTALLMLFFGFPGAVFGSLVFARMSDRLAKRSIINRAYLIVFAIVALFASVIIFFFIPFPSLGLGGTENEWALLQNPIIWLVGLFLFLIRAVLGIYHINQSPIIQAINLPEAQGVVSSWNQFLETIGHGLGSLVAGLVLTSFNNDYQLAAVVCMVLGLPGAVLWLVGARHVERDVGRVDALLNARAEELDRDQDDGNGNDGNGNEENDGNDWNEETDGAPAAREPREKNPREKK